jgi:16S rRNA processing protein RimM
MAYKYTGTIIKAKGIAGMMVIHDVPEDTPQFKPGIEILIGYSEKFSKKYVLKSWKNFKRTAEIQVEGINAPEMVPALREKGIFIEESHFYEDAGDKYFYTEDVVGCKVVDIHTRKPIGTVLEVWYTPANSVLLVSTDKGELPIPYTENVIKGLDLKRKIIKVKMMEGLWDLVKK